MLTTKGYVVWRRPAMPPVAEEARVSQADLLDPVLLHDHLVHHHHRPSSELTGMPLGAIHRLEHFDDAMGMLALDHRHPA
jgi:hypothetical protein